MSNQTHPAGFHPIRRDRLPLETVMDSYKTKGKLPEPTVCPAVARCSTPATGNGWQNPRMRIRQPAQPATGYEIIYRRDMCR